MRTAGEILGEYESQEWTGREWQCAHRAVVCAQREALEAAILTIETQTVNSNWLSALAWAAKAIRALVPAEPGS